MNETQTVPLPIAPVRPISGVPEYYAISPFKLIIFSGLSFGIYEIYWFYKQWAAIRENRRGFENLSPLVRAFFAPFWVGSLLSRVRNDCELRGVSVSYRPWLLAAAYIALIIAIRLPDPYWLITLLTGAALVPAQLAINSLHSRYWSANVKGWLPRGWEWGFLLFGAIWLFLLLIGMLVPEPVSTEGPPGLALLPPN